nr:MAG TPA: hypothetical protein [Caudoviricetes sp.]
MKPAMKRLYAKGRLCRPAGNQRHEARSLPA